MGYSSMVRIIMHSSLRVDRTEYVLAQAHCFDNTCKSLWVHISHTSHGARGMIIVSSCSKLTCKQVTSVCLLEKSYLQFSRLIRELENDVFRSFGRFDVSEQSQDNISRNVWAIEIILVLIYRSIRDAYIIIRIVVTA